MTSASSPSLNSSPPEHEWRYPVENGRLVVYGHRVRCIRCGQMAALLADGNPIDEVLYHGQCKPLLRYILEGGDNGV